MAFGKRAVAVTETRRAILNIELCGRCHARVAYFRAFCPNG